MKTHEGEQQSASKGLAYEEEGTAPATGVLDYLASIPFVLYFLGVLVFYEILLRFAHNQADRERAAAGLNRGVRNSLRVVGTKIVIKIDQMPDENRPWLVVSNHQSLFDISVLHTIFAEQRPKFVAKQELGRGIPGVSIVLREEGSALIDRSDARQSISAIKKLGAAMTDDKFCTVLFPEGTRAKRGKMKPFKPRGLETLLKHCPSAVVVPVAIDGSWKLAYRKYGPIPWGVTMTFKVGSSIDPSEKDRKEVVEEVEGSVQQLLTAIRSS